MKNFKKILSIMIFSTLIVACGGKEQTVDLQKNQVEMNGKVITLNDNVKDVIEKLGECKNVKESKSCLFDGNDKTYDYNDIIITTYPQKENDLVSSITVSHQDIKISSGIKIGDSLEQILQAYGDGYVSQDDVACSYEFGDYGIIFYLEDEHIQQYDVYLLQ